MSTARPGAAGVVIVGTGIAGISAAEMLRANGYPGPVSVIGAEATTPCRRTALSKDLLRADLSDERIRLRPSMFWTERDIEVRTGIAVEQIDTDARTIVLSDGTARGYDALILATGGTAVRPAMMADVLTLRARDDAEAIRAAIGSAGRVTIIGGGLIGLEIAASAAAAGHAVAVVEGAERVMERVVPEQISELIANVHRSHGVTLDCGVRVIEATGERVIRADGERMGGPVVAALGLRPDTALAAAAGLEVSSTGIIVDDRMRTSAAGVYAAGDVAAVPHPLTGTPHRAEHWLAAAEQGKAAAHAVLADLTGDTAPAYREIPLAWTVQYGLNLQIAGSPTAGNRIEIDGSLADHDATVRSFDGDTLVGAVAVGRPRDGRTTRAEIAAHLDRLAV